MSKEIYFDFGTLRGVGVSKLDPLPEADNPEHDFIAIPVEYKTWAVKNSNSGWAVEYGTRERCEYVADELNRAWAINGLVVTKW
jgi:hypothetical protein